jgi:DNA-binding NtrC family response regulator
VKKKILSISYDEPLLATRQMILQNAGYGVVSALGFTEAIDKSKGQKFDLAIMGHSIPMTDKTVMAKTIKQDCHCPIVSIRRHGYEPMPESDYSIDAIDGPEALLVTIRQVLKEKKKK